MPNFVRILLIPINVSDMNIMLYAYSNIGAFLVPIGGARKEGFLNNVVYLKIKENRVQYI